MPGAIWKLENLAEEGSIHSPGGQAAYDAAKALVEASGGLLQIGPGLEALVLGSFLGTKTALVRITNTGKHFIGGLRVADLIDPTKSVFFDPAAVAAATERIVTLPNWNGLLPLPADAGVSGQFLRSSAPGQPSWASIANALLDGANHSDTLAQAVVSGDLIIGNATPKWARLAKGTDGQALVLVAGLPAWSAIPSASHETLAHLKPFQVASVTWNAGSADLSTSGNGFANVRVGDFIFLGNNTTFSTQGARVLTKTDDNNITADLTKDAGDANLVGVSVIFQPGDHWDDTLVLDVGVGAGLLLTLGRGTYSLPSRASGTFQELRGPMRWRPQAGGNLVSDFRAQMSPSTTTLSGFCLEEATGGSRAYFFGGLLAADRVYSWPNVSGQVVIVGGAQTLTDKTLDTNNKIAVDGTATRTVFTSGGGADRLVFNVDDQTALRVAKWQDHSFAGHVDNTYVTRSIGIDAKTVATTNLFTVPTGKSFIVTKAVVRVTAASAVTVGPTFGIGIAAGEDDIVASASAALTVADTYDLVLPKVGAVVALTGQIIKLGIDVAATGTSMTLAVDLSGYLV